jgi:FkbM family methyltransferase
MQAKNSNPRKLAFVLGASDQGPLIVNRFDNHRDEYGVGFQILEKASYDPIEVEVGASLLELRRRVAGNGVVAIDCGANIGVHTTVWARRMTGWGSIIAIEAQERIYYALAGNIALNNCFNARAIWAVVRSCAGTMKIPVPDYLSPASFGSLELEDRGNAEFIGQSIDYSEAALTPVTCVTLDSLGCQRVDLIKIDVEGMEFDVLDGAQRLLANHRPIVLAETLKVGRAPLITYLEDRGYVVRTFGIILLAVHGTDAVLPRLGEIPQLGDRFTSPDVRLEPDHAG